MEKDKTHQKEMDFNKFEEVYYMYETPDTGLFQSTVLIQGLDLASIDSLNREIKEQYGIIVFKEDAEYEETEVETGKKIVEVIGRADMDNYLICQEGAFFWDDFDCEYRYAGTFNEQDVHRVKNLVIPEDIAMLIGDEITVVKSGTYEIEQEEVKESISNIRIEMFTIQLLSKDLVTIPNCPGLFRVYEADKAFVE